MTKRQLTDTEQSFISQALRVAGEVYGKDSEYAANLIGGERIAKAFYIGKDRAIMLADVIDKCDQIDIIIDEEEEL